MVQFSGVVRVRVDRRLFLVLARKNSVTDSEFTGLLRTPATSSITISNRSCIPCWNSSNISVSRINQTEKLKLINETVCLICWLPKEVGDLIFLTCLVFVLSCFIWELRPNTQTNLARSALSKGRCDGYVSWGKCVWRCKLTLTNLAECDEYCPYILTR